MVKCELTQAELLQLPIATRRRVLAMAMENYANEATVLKRQALEYFDALLDYSSHDSRCNPLNNCSCGLDAVIEQARITFATDIDTNPEK